MVEETTTDRTSGQRQTRRREALKAVARAAGWRSWTEFETAVINGRVPISDSQFKSIQEKEQTK